MTEHAPVHSRACWIDAPLQAELRSATLPELAADEVRVRTLHSGVSRGTETLVFRGEVPASETQRMRAPFQEGDFSFPVKYGYVNVGRVEAGPKDLIGQLVFCLHPHQTVFQVPVAAVLPLPPEVPAARAVLANTPTIMSIAIRFIARSFASMANRVLNGLTALSADFADYADKHNEQHDNKFSRDEQRLGF